MEHHHDHAPSHQPPTSSSSTPSASSASSTARDCGCGGAAAHHPTPEESRLTSAWNAGYEASQTGMQQDIDGAHKKGYALGLTVGGAVLMFLGWYVGR
jgi:hypothetical protein